MDDTLDRIDRHIDIDATAEQVWDLVTRPGWWINTGSIDRDPVLRHEDGFDVLDHPTYGVFRLATVQLDRPRYAAMRWHGEPNDQVADPSTLVEFWIEERAEGGVTLKVAETGFSSLGKEPADWLRHRDENTAGWEKELAAARDHLVGEPAETR